MQKAYKLHGVHKHYDWGGTKYIPDLMQLSNPQQLPYAEYWMGAHPSAPASLETAQGPISIQTLGTVPYLFKVLDVAKMLSIQVHPNKPSAEIGFAFENKAGIAIDAPNRNYKDQNHKPEVMVALSDFWLLHGFLTPTLLKERLQAFSCFHSLLPYFGNNNYQGLYQYFMQLPGEEADLILKPLIKEAIASVAEGKVDKSHPHWWANKYYQGVLPENNIDKGIFSIYILNIVQVEKYQAVFQGAGLLHAYLEGQNIELMANSDNVLRGGLTPKHIDIEELLKHIQFDSTIPVIMNGNAINQVETNYPCPVPDFGISKLTLTANQTYTLQAKEMEILLLEKGELWIEDNMYKAGEVALITAGVVVELNAKSDAVVFRSFVP
jgi:mannose-6-phosphate isomerase